MTDRGKQFENDLSGVIQTAIEIIGEWISVLIELWKWRSRRTNQHVGAKNNTHRTTHCLKHRQPDIGSAPDELVYLYPMISFIPLRNIRWSIFVLKDLSSVSHVFLRVDATRTLHQTSYDGPYANLQLHYKEFKVQPNSQVVRVSIDRINSVFVLREDSLNDHSYSVNEFDISYHKNEDLREFLCVNNFSIIFCNIHLFIVFY